jgi:hypothetical protein
MGMSPADKQQFANEAEKALDHEAVQHAIQEFADNMGFVLEGLPAYGLNKVAHYAAMVARAQALGIDPDELRYTPEEANGALMEKAAQMVYAGVPTKVVCGDCGGSGKIRRHQGGPGGGSFGWMKCPTCKGSA